MQRVAGLVCAVAGVLLYLNSLDCQLVFDDRAAIVDNQDLRPEYPWSNLLWHDFWGEDIRSPHSHKSFRPLSMLTFKLNYHLHQLEPAGYHLVNVLLYGAVCYLYVQVCVAVFGELWPAVMAGLLFVVHPIHTEAVAGVVGRAESLSSLFFLSSLLSYRRGVHLKCWKWVFLSMLLCLCSVLSKEQGITVLGVCLAYEFFIEMKMDWRSSLNMVTMAWKNPEKLPKPVKQFLKRALFLSSVAVLIMLGRVWHMKQGPQFGRVDNPAQTLTTPYRQLYILYLCVVNSWLLVNPSQLLHDWRMGAVPLVDAIDDPHHLLTLATFAIIATLGLYGMMNGQKKLKIVPFALSFVVFTFLPASNLLFFIGFVVAERVLYIPSMGYCILVAYAIWQIIRSHNEALQWVAKIGLGFLLVIHSAKTLHRNRVWYSELDLDVEAIKVHPGNGLMFSNLGFEYSKYGELAKAEAAYKIALQLAPHLSQSYRNYGVLLKDLNRFEEAEQAFRKALQIMNPVIKRRSKILQTYNALAEVVSQNSSRFDEAVKISDKAISLNPNIAESHFAKGVLLMNMNRTKAAKAAFEETIRLNPSFSESYVNIGLLYATEGDYDKAEEWYRKVTHVNARAVLELGVLYSESSDIGKRMKSKKYLQAIAGANPDMARPQYHLALVHLEFQNITQAEMLLLNVVQLEPNHQDALLKLGHIYYSQKNYSAAIGFLKRLDPINEEGVMLLSNCYLETMDVDSVKEVYDRFLQKHPHHTSVLYKLGLLHSHVGDHEEAIRVLTQTVELDPSHQAAREALIKSREMRKNQQHNT